MLLGDQGKNLAGAYLAEVQMGREGGGAGDRGEVPPLSVARQPLSDEGLGSLQGRRLPRLPAPPQPLIPGNAG
jgi:hypothetical protein